MRIIGGKFKGKKLISPKSDNIRPTSDRAREAIFNILASKINNDFSKFNILDLFAGTGALGIEAISRGGQSVVFVDNDVNSRALIRSNIENFALGGVAKLLKRDAGNLGKNEKFEPFNLVFLDPPYGKNLGERALLSASMGGWIERGAIIILEEGAKNNIELASDFIIFDKRKYGESKIWFLRFGK